MICIPVRITRRLYEMRYVEVARSHLLWKTKRLPMHWRESKTNSKGQSYTFCLYPLVQQGKLEEGVVLSKQGYQLGFFIFLIIINWQSCFQYTWPPLLRTQSPALLGQLINKRPAQSWSSGKILSALSFPWVLWILACYQVTSLESS